MPPRHRLRWIGVVAVCLFLTIVTVPLAARERASPDGVWLRADAGAAPSPGAKPWIQPLRYEGMQLDGARLLATLAQAPPEGSVSRLEDAPVLTLPTPWGTYERFRIVQTPLLGPRMQALHPEIRAYSGYGMDDSTARMRADWTVLGFRAQVLSAAHGAWYVDPLWRDDVTRYAAYAKTDLVNDERFTCDVETDWGRELRLAPSPAALTLGTQLRTFRFAMACTGEYGQWYGGVAQANAGIATTVNRMSQIYEVDVAIRLLLVGTDVFTDPNTDPYGAGDPRPIAQIQLDTNIGFANYDIGHVVSQGGSGGVASLGCVCSTTKAWGTTSLATPQGDAFDVDYVAHEVGHQFGGRHTWNGLHGSCSSAGQWAAGAAMEPGSGTTVMAYAGICGADDVPDQPTNPGPGVGFSDPYFHSISQEDIDTFVTVGGGSACAIVTATANTPPTANAGPDYTIPQLTPFLLTGSGGDADGDTITYCWEERDLGAQAALSTPDDGSIPLFRSRVPTTNPYRVFPKLPDLMAGNFFPAKLAEQLPSTNRTMVFRLTVRDGRMGGGGIATDDANVTVDASTGPFRVTYPNGGEVLGTNTVHTVTWNPAGTTGGSVNEATVDILLSLDGGATWPFPIVLVSNTANDGSENVIFPCSDQTTQGRILVRASNNIFFDVSDANFTIQDLTPPVATASVTRPLLWPPTFGMFPVGLSWTATDDCDPSPHVDLIVHSSEAPGVPPLAPDAQWGTDLRLRSERNWPGTGRIYVIAIRVTDAAGNVGVACASVIVPAMVTIQNITLLQMQAAAKRAECVTAGGGAPAGYTQILSVVLVP